VLEAGWGVGLEKSDAERVGAARGSTGTGAGRIERGLQQAAVPSRNGAGTEAMVIGFIGLTLLSWFGVRAP
jgi:hypothetical protein